MKGWLLLVAVCVLFLPSHCFIPQNLKQLQQQLNLIFQGSSGEFISTQVQSRGFGIGGQPATINYTFTEWSNYSDCSVACGGGFRDRERNCTNDEGVTVPLHRCLSRRTTSPLVALRRFLDGSNYNSDVERESCNQQECKLSAWNDWSSCDKVCGGGKQYTSRTCLDALTGDQTCDFQEHKVRDCNTQACYRFTDWSDYTNCTQECDSGTQERTRNCEPNLEVTHPEYARLSAVQSLSAYYNLIVSLNSDSVEHQYLRSYQRDCGRYITRERRVCNIHSCPACPNNQVYYHCKPCLTRCERQTTQNFQQLFSGLFQIEDLFSTGCNGECDRGCSCPKTSRYYGSDGACYLANFFCPINQILSVQEEGIFGRPFQSSIIPPTATPYDVIAPTTYDITTDEEPVLPPVGEGVDDVFGKDDKTLTSKPDCPYNILITTVDNQTHCECRNGFVDPAACSRDSSSTCPVYCRPFTP